MPITSQEQYEKAQGLLQSGKAKDPKKLSVAMQRWESIAMPQKATIVEGIGPGTAFDKLQTEATLQQAETGDAARVSSQATKAGYNIDLSQPDVIQNLAVDPKRTEVIEKVRQATRDDALPNASKLKVFNDPPDYVPPKPKLSLANPLAFLPTALQRHYFYEPSVAEFRSAMTDGNIARRLKKEFNLVEDLSKVSDEDLENSTTFKAFQDASWKHSLADAMKNGYAISRVSQTKEMGGFDKFQAGALDPSVAAATGAVRGMTGGLSLPTETDEEGRSVSRNPNAALGGEIAGTLTPTGLPSRIATGTARVLGKAGLGSKGVQGVIKGITAATATGAADASLREIAKFTADALDAGDTAEEAAQRLYETAQGLPSAALRGAGYGAAFGAGGEALGGLAKLGARGIVGGKPKDVLLNANSSGVKMGGLGEPVLPKDLTNLTDEAAAMSPRAEADSLLAERAIPKLMTQRLKDQEGLKLRALEETSAARAKLDQATIDTKPVADRIMAYAERMPGGTPEASAKKTAIRRYARRIRNEGRATAERWDAILDEIDSQANQGEKRIDKQWNDVSAIAREARDEFQFNEPTRADNYAIRDSVGKTKGVSDYSGMNTRQSVERSQFEFDNAKMGMPTELKAAPVRLGNKSPAETAQFFESHPSLPKIQEYFNSERAVASDVERSNFSRPKDNTRTANATEAQYAANKALIEAVNDGMGYQGTTYRGVRMAPEEVQKLIASGKVKNDHLWSTSKDESHAAAFAKKGSGGEPVLFTIEGSSGVDLDSVPGLNTFDEVGIPTGRQFRVTDSYRDKDGILRVKLSDGTRGPTGDEVSAMAEGTEPRARLLPENHDSVKGRLLGIADPKNHVTAEKFLKLAKRAGVETERDVVNIQRLRDAQNWKEYLGRAISGIGSGGGTYVKMNNTLRAVPTLNSLSGGLPKMEATKEASDVVDRFLEQAVPSWRGLHTRGGQAARPAGSIAARREEKPRDTLTEEEAQFAAAVLKNLMDMNK